MGEVNSKPGTAGLGGGAMINTRNSLVSLTNCSFFNNNALRGGGLGVYEANSDIYLTDVSFSNNLAERFAGGMFALVKYSASKLLQNYVRVIPSSFKSHSKCIPNAFQIKSELHSKLLPNAFTTPSTLTSQ